MKWLWLVAWLLGCPLLCLAFPQDSMYGKPCPEMCGILSYSVSASMTGHYPKIWGTLTATLFAVLVVQRSTNGLCALLKLGWLVRFSPLIPSSSSLSSSITENNNNNNNNNKELALALWKRIIRIESVGYMAGFFLISLVVFDAKFFPTIHNATATLAFGCLYLQNYFIGTLERDFPTIIPNWTHPRSKEIFSLAFVHWTIMGFFMFCVFGTLQYWNRCDLLTNILGDEQGTLWWLTSTVYWYNEYAFGLLCIYIQMWEHWELQLWKFAGDEQMPVAAILSRFSLYTAIERMIYGGQGELFLLETMTSNNDGSQTTETTDNNSTKEKSC